MFYTGIFLSFIAYKTLPHRFFSGGLVNVIQQHEDGCVFVIGKPGCKKINQSHLSTAVCSDMRKLRSLPFVEDSNEVYWVWNGAYIEIGIAFYRTTAICRSRFSNLELFRTAARPQNIW